MKSIQFLLLGLLLAAGQVFAGTVPHTWTSTYNPSPDLYIGQTVDFSFDITTGPLGYRPGIDSLNQSTLSISFNLFDDPSDQFRVCVFGICGTVTQPREIAVIDLPFFLGDRAYTNLGGAETAGSTSPAWQGWNVLVTTGRLDVSVSALAGDFMFGDATLEVSGNRVPEPGSLLLAALGLGLLASRQRKTQQLAK